MRFFGNLIKKKKGKKKQKKRKKEEKMKTPNLDYTNILKEKLSSLLVSLVIINYTIWGWKEEKKYLEFSKLLRVYFFTVSWY